MGRGRAKAKQTKVARAMKYGCPQTDVEGLQAELAGGGAVESSEIDSNDPGYDAGDPYAADPYAADPYAKYVEDDDSEES
jgi:Protein of unknown function (DUF3073).